MKVAAPIQMALRSWSSASSRVTSPAFCCSGSRYFDLLLLDLLLLHIALIQTGDFTDDDNCGRLDSFFDHLFTQFTERAA